MSKSKISPIDYNVLGVTPSKYIDDLTQSFVAALAEKKRPDSHFVWGPPGIGKTFCTYDIARQVAEKTGQEVQIKCLPTSTLEPVDIGGLPHVEGPYFTYKAPIWAYQGSTELPDGPPMILFADDLPAAHPQTQAAFFKGVHEGLFGDVQLRDNVMIVGAGNRVSDNAAAHDMPTALASRFIHHYMKVNASEWAEWATRKGTILPEVIAYISRNPSALHDFNPAAEEKAYPCPRSWEILTRRLSVFGLDDPNIFKRAAGVVGQGHATQFIAFLKYRNKLVAPEEIMKNPLKAKIHEARELDAMYITIISLNVYLTNNPTVANILSAMQYVNRDGILPEIGVLTGMHVFSSFLVGRPGGLSAKDRQTLGSHPVIQAFATKHAQDLNAVL